MKKPKLLLFGIDGGMSSHIKKEVDKGHLPGFKRLMERGVFFSDCMPVFPSISPTCWNSIYTGAVPKVHGALCQQIHPTGNNPWDNVPGNSSLQVKAEKFWETASEKGVRTLVLNAYSSGMPKTENVTQVLGNLSTSTKRDSAKSYVSGVPRQIYSINAKNDKVKLRIDGTKEAGGGQSEYEHESVISRQIKENVFEFDVFYDVGGYMKNEVEDFSWIIITEPDGVRIGASEEDARKCELITLNKWSDVIQRELMTDEGHTAIFNFRARLNKFDKENKFYEIYIPASLNMYKEVYPKSFADEITKLSEIHSTFDDYDKMLVNSDLYFETRNFDSEWRKKVIKYAIDNCDYDIILDYEGGIDTVNHMCQGVYEGYESPIYKHFTPDGYPFEKAKEMADKNIEKMYEIVDEHLGWLLDNAVDENTTICVVSDHGSVGGREDANPYYVLGKAGLSVYTTDKKWQMANLRENTDWSKTKAYAIGSAYINVNLKGREPCGIVEPEDYDKVVAEIIEALHKEVRTEDGKTRGIAFAVPKDQAGFVGLGGENCGDVVYGMLGSDLGGYSGGVHAEQIPSAKNKTGGDIHCVCIMSGKGFKQNAIIERPIDLTDIAPTLCYATGLPQPKDATGGIIFQAFDKNCF